jgi:NAD(P) transhydrogenase subunit beta
MLAGLAPLIYLVSAALFIIGIKRLQKPDTARNGNLMSGLGMLIAIVVTLLDQQVVTFEIIIAGVAVGGGLGFWMARSVKMTSMPQMVALLNGFGGGASLLVGGAEFLKAGMLGVPLSMDTNTTIQLGSLIGAVTLMGSFIAFLKLQEWMTGNPITYPLQKSLNALVALSIVALGVYQVVQPGQQVEIYYAMVGLSLLLGVLVVIPIGGADMPVVIALLNSYSGIAAAMTGFVIDNQVLIVAGSLVGSSGLILTNIMCKAMNRSLANVLFGAFGGDSGGGTSKSAEGLSVNEVTVEDAALRLAYARLVIVVPGYGLAVAQAQHVVRELADLIQKNGGEVKYAIHPVAGRMPGHMNVLLAESNVPYDQLVEMDDINPQFPRADVALVIGANDVVNPAAHTDPSSPIYGMPILEVEHAQSAIVMKRSMNPGFAGIQNELFYHPKTSMLFGDAKASLTALVGEIKAL